MITNSPVRRALITVAVLTPIVITSCGSTTTAPPANTPGGGFAIQTFYHPSSGPVVIAGGVRFLMKYVADDGNFGNYYPAGDTSDVAWVTDVNGNFSDPTGRSPADWSFTWTASGTYPQCFQAPDNGATLYILPIAMTVNEIGCYQINLPTPHIALNVDTPNAQLSFSSLTEPSPPLNIHVSGSGFETTYGMPVVQVYDSYGNQLASVTATSATANSVVVPASGFSAVDFGTYYGFVLNVDFEGNFNAVGTGLFKKICTLPAGESCE